MTFLGPLVTRKTTISAPLISILAQETVSNLPHITLYQLLCQQKIRDYLNLYCTSGEWFAASEKYMPKIYELCKSNGVKFIEEVWWPNLDECKTAGIPIYRFIQKPGDVVFVNAGCLHWVMARGTCNNVAWNVGPMTARQYSMAMKRYAFNLGEGHNVF